MTTLMGHKAGLFVSEDGRTDAPPPIVARRDSDERRVPAWIQRKNEQGIARDETGRAT